MRNLKKKCFNGAMSTNDERQFYEIVKIQKEDWKVTEILWLLDWSFGKKYWVKDSDGLLVNTQSVKL